VKLPDRPRRDDLLVWCDYLLDGAIYPESVIGWLRLAISQGLRTWMTLGTSHAWDSRRFPSIATPLSDSLAAGELPYSLWLRLDEGHDKYPRYKGDVLSRKIYPSADDAWHDLARAVAHQLAMSPTTIESLE
jgi:hypothetical protein